MPFPARLRSLSLGLVLGGSAAWLGTRAMHFGPPPPLHPATTLAPDSVASVIDAWFALRAADGTPAGFALRADTLRTLLARLPAAEFPRLLGPLAALATPDDRQLLSVAFEVWVELDPAAACRWLGALPSAPGLDYSRLARLAGEEWAARDPLAASTWTCTLPEEDRAVELASLILPRLAATDPAAVLALATARGAAFLDRVLPALLLSLAATDPVAAIRTYGPAVWNKGAGFWLLRGALSTWLTQDPPGALAWLAARPRRNDSELSTWLGNLATGNADHPALAAALATVPGIPDRASVLGGLYHTWNATDPRAALAWLKTLPDSQLRKSLLELASRFTNPDAPEQSLPIALAMSEGANRTDRLADLLGQWAARDPSAALAWIRKHDDAPGVLAASASARAAILGTIARDEPATALAQWRAADPKTQAAALYPMTEAWGRTDPAAALRWLATQDASIDRIRSHANTLHAWSKQDPLAALRWAETLPPDSRPVALTALSGTWKEKAPRAATADLYAQIKDPALRTQFVTDHVREWLTKDPAAAKTWLESHDALTPAQAAALLAPAK